jgi:hypothetical protein
MTTQARTFDEWMAQVDSRVWGTVGLSVHDLEDCSFRDWFDDGVSVATAAKRVLRQSGWRG